LETGALPIELHSYETAAGAKRGSAIRAVSSIGRCLFARVKPANALFKPPVLRQTPLKPTRANGRSR